ncbi:GATOR complex protein NPRL3 [Amphibalanus amphitrite]|uniref:GATOR complex protein NPRL3 n=1 Tax=Amphibalanus amphitrite TaxID=1232801 RepID=A0A6A4VYZ9_AMPAM|nr:GATOR complex protein NPRL3 [Amphibalanus amphitrite]
MEDTDTDEQNLPENGSDARVSCDVLLVFPNCSDGALHPFVGAQARRETSLSTDVLLEFSLPHCGFADPAGALLRVAAEYRFKGLAHLFRILGFMVHVADGAPPVSAPSLDQLAEAPLASLTDPEREAVLKVPAAKDPDKLRLFTRLLQYFNGMHHLEEIMYRENLRRGRFTRLLEEFGDVLTTCQRCDEMSVHHDSRCD